MAMDSVAQAILREVAKANAEGREICFTDLKTKGIAAGPTVQKRIMELLDTGELIGVSKQTPHGTKRVLFTAGAYTPAKGEDVRITALLGMILYTVQCIAERLDAKPARAREDDGMEQLSLEQSLPPSPRQAPTPEEAVE